MAGCSGAGSFLLSALCWGNTDPPYRPPPSLQGLRKPSAESFAAVVQHLGVPPEGLLFVDDRQANVEGARAAGIPAIRFESAEQLEGELRQRGFAL